ncbi:GNA1162 family protein, partial [Klebsiella pneumoniae]|uniref:GNA1162 family protein n=1 Tax=Klebsiella pneumoniae TaxID=573 RepID=UPI003D2F2967
MSTGSDIHAVSPSKIREIYGAESVLKKDVTQYGTSYQVIASETRVSASAKLVDLRNGALLWSGHDSASSAEGDTASNVLVG